MGMRVDAGSVSGEEEEIKGEVVVVDNQMMDRMVVDVPVAMCVCVCVLCVCVCEKDICESHMISLPPPPPSSMQHILVVERHWPQKPQPVGLLPWSKLVFRCTFPPSSL